jgi:hypothetical protein
MSIKVKVQAKVVGQKKALFNDWRVPIPPQSDGGRLTLRDLISFIVDSELVAFRERQEVRRLTQVLSREDIEAGAVKGKIDSGEQTIKQDVDNDQAVGAALQAFEDGLYYVFIDEVQQEGLDQTIFVSDDSHILFVRLVALVGG